MNAYRKIQIHTPGQIVTAWAGILAAAAVMLISIVLC
jgi:hypothetical protein